jgi:hypothetical protein
MSSNPTVAEIKARLREYDHGSRLPLDSHSPEDLRWLLAEHARLAGEVETLVDALECLRDAQNGPPLLAPHHVKFWEDAMAKTQAALAAVRAAQPKEPLMQPEQEAERIEGARLDPDNPAHAVLLKNIHGVVWRKDGKPVYTVPGSIVEHIAAALASAGERERRACARIADSAADGLGNEWWDRACEHISKVIRARAPQQAAQATAKGGEDWAALRQLPPATAPWTESEIAALGGDTASILRLIAAKREWQRIAATSIPAPAQGEKGVAR